MIPLLLITPLEYSASSTTSARLRYNPAMGTLSHEFYLRDPIEVARELVGKLLIRRSREGTCIGRIVETEAYLSAGDPACHAHRGRNRKNGTMFGPAGRLYVYPIHARHCMNAVTEGANVGSAVLLRAVEPIAGIELMQQRRGCRELLDLARGPGRLCEAFGVGRQLDGWDLVRGTRIWIEESEAAANQEICISPRIGVTSAQDRELRFFLRGSSFVSGPKKVGGGKTGG